MFDAEVEPLSTKWNPQRVGPRTKYQKDESRSAALDKVLCEWRREEFYHSYPDRCHDMWVGDWLVLPDDIIDDIIYLAHLNKLTCHDKFIQLVDWINCERYASELIPIIHQIFPPPEPPAITPNAPGTTEGNLRVSRCSNCRSSGHNGMPLLLLLHGTNKFVPLARTCSAPCGACGETGHTREYFCPVDPFIIHETDYTFF